MGKGESMKEIGSLKAAIASLLDVASYICFDKEERKSFKEWLISELEEFE